MDTNNVSIGLLVSWHGSMSQGGHQANFCEQLHGPQFGKIENHRRGLGAALRYWLIGAQIGHHALSTVGGFEHNAGATIDNDGCR